MAFGSAFAPEEMRVGVMEGCGGREGGREGGRGGGGGREGGTEILAIFSRKDQKKGGGNQKAAKMSYTTFFSPKKI